MTVVLFEPHHDDAVLFATYTLLKEKPLVVTVMGASADERPMESRQAMLCLGVAFEHWPHPEVSPDFREIKYDMGELRDAVGVTRVLAPAIEDGGHEQHSRVGRLAAEVFGADRVTHYLTYRRGNMRSQSDNEVVPQPGWMASKMEAMSCYSSQIERENTRAWFTSDWSREWLQ